MSQYSRSVCSLLAVGGRRTVWAIPFPTRMDITNLVISQVGGVAVSFTIQIYDSAKVISDSHSSEYGSPEECNPDMTIHQIGGTLNSDAAGIMRKQFDPAVPYVNMDSRGSTGKRQMIYLEIVPAGSGDKTFDVGFNGYVPE